MNEMVDEMLTKKKSGMKQGEDFAEEERERELVKLKEARKQARKDEKDEKKSAEAEESYLEVEQFDFMYDKCNSIKRRLQRQQGCIDQLEKKLIDVIGRRMEKEQIAHWTNKQTDG